jgi:hypothetical protein
MCSRLSHLLPNTSSKRQYLAFSRLESDDPLVSHIYSIKDKCWKYAYPKLPNQSDMNSDSDQFQSPRAHPHSFYQLEGKFGLQIVHNKETLLRKHAIHNSLSDPTTAGVLWYPHKGTMHTFGQWRQIVHCQDHGQLTNSFICLPTAVLLENNV